MLSQWGVSLVMGSFAAQDPAVFSHGDSNVYIFSYSLGGPLCKHPMGAQCKSAHCNYWACAKVCILSESLFFARASIAIAQCKRSPRVNR